jgi:uncharacterized membrane protein YfcA
MLATLPFSIAVGVILGFLTGLGTGGGSLLILWLTLVLHMDPAQARLINLMFFLPAALVATFLNWCQGRVPIKKILLPAAAGCAAALLTASVGQKIDTESLKKLFGVLLLFTGLRELFYRPRKPK